MLSAPLSPILLSVVSELMGMVGVCVEITHHTCSVFEGVCLIEELWQRSLLLHHQYCSLLCEMVGVFVEITHHTCSIFEGMCLIEELWRCSLLLHHQCCSLLCVS